MQVTPVASEPGGSRGTRSTLFRFRCAQVIAACALFAAPSYSSAQTTPSNPHDAQPERPSVAVHAWTAAPGWIEIEAGMELDRYPDHVHGQTAPLNTKIGLKPHTQFEVQSPIVHAQGLHTVPGDVLIGVKWRAVDAAPVLASIAVFPSLKLPTGSTSQGAGTGTTDLGIVLISSREFGEVSLDMNVGLTHHIGDDDVAPHESRMWAISCGGPLRGPIGWAAEMFGFPHTSGPSGDRSVVATLVGPTMRVRSWLVVDAGVIVPMTGPQPTALYAGGVYNIGRVAP
jgi:hypothetical protein